MAKRSFIALLLFIILFSILMFGIQVLGFLPVLDVLGRWSYTAPVAIIFITLIFKNELATLMKGISSASLGKDGLKFEITQLVKYVRGEEPSALIGNEASLLTFDDIKEVFSKITYLKRIPDDEFEKLVPHVWFQLVDHGILTRASLEAMASSEKVMNTLAKLYIEVLARDKNTPLDPTAISSWAPYLFINSVSKASIEFVRHRLRNSEEYRKNNADATTS